MAVWSLCAAVDPVKATNKQTQLLGTTILFIMPPTTALPFKQC